MFALPSSPILFILLATTLLLAILWLVSLKRYFDLESGVKSHSDQLIRKLYETAVLEEIGQRIGYSLNVTQIAEIITGSLSNLVGFSTASYLIITPEKLVFRSVIRESVSKNFITEIKKKMLASLLALDGQDLSKIPWDEASIGSSVSEASRSSVKSFFNIPLVINGRLSGIITIASMVSGMYKEEDTTVLYKISKRASEAVAKLEAVLAAEKGKLEVMVESLADGVLMVDMSLNLVVINPAARRLLKLPKVGDVSFFDVLEKLDPKIPLRKSVDESLRFEKNMVVGDLSLEDSFIQVIVSPVRSPHGLLGAALIFHDQTQEKALERLRDDFTAMMVHELRTPLSVMYATSDLIIKRVAQLSPEKLLELLNNIRESSNDLLDLVNDVLDATKVEAGKFKVTLLPGDVGKLLKEEQQFFGPEAQRRGLEIKLAVQSDLPKVLFDKVRVSQVIRNLVSNSLKFTEKGSITLGAQVYGARGEVAVSVSDTGTGIPADAQEKLFNKFEQMRNPVDPKAKGTGLGLVITKGIVEAHGGRIWLESAVGKGTTFYFTLPVEGTRP